MKQLICLVGCMVAMAGCTPGAIGKSETDAAFPKQDQASMEAELAKEGKLDEYKAAQERDKQYEAQGRASEAQRGQPGAPEGPTPR
ncbi:MAG: hypothetical protein JNK63_03155 [Chthonomonas sp.]|nr:hypothetical protein [Chthonomonas sp.]